MEIRQNLPTLTRDNDKEYIQLVEDVIQFADPHCAIIIAKTAKGLTVKVEPSNKKFKQQIIDNILSIHHRLELVPKFSSSLKIQKNIYYTLEY